MMYRVTKDMFSPRTVSDDFVAGYNYFVDHRGDKKNPHQKGSQKYQEWENGWKDAWLTDRVDAES